MNTYICNNSYIELRINELMEIWPSQAPTEARTLILTVTSGLRLTRARHVNNRQEQRGS